MKRPSQQRGIATFERILDAASQILAEKGLQGLNTNRVAELAAVTPPTIYRYFDDKVDLLSGLCERFLTQELDWLATAQNSLGAEFSTSAWVDTMVSGYWRQALSFTGLPELRQAMKSYEALAVYEERSLGNATELAREVLVGHFGFPSNKAANAARFLIETTCSTVDRCYDMSMSASNMRVRELKKMLTQYLELG